MAYERDATHAWAVGGGGLLTATRDGGLTWQDQRWSGVLRDSLDSVHFVDTQNGWAVGSGGRLLETSTGGE